jgi:uncharacterized membrane protein YphA (DoxX/SURF4 family)
VTLRNLLIIFSGTSFLFYGINFFVSSKMKAEFKRFGLERLGTVTAYLELLGGVGLLLGLYNYKLSIISSGGLALLMFCGIIVRIKIRDSFLLTLPALLYFLLNLYIFLKV